MTYYNIEPFDESREEQLEAQGKFEKEQADRKLSRKDWNKKNLEGVVHFGASCVGLLNAIGCGIPGAVKGVMDGLNVPSNIFGYGLVYVPLTVSAGIGYIVGGLESFGGDSNAPEKYTLTSTVVSGAFMAAGYGIGYAVTKSVQK